MRFQDIGMVLLVIYSGLIGDDDSWLEILLPVLSDPGDSEDPAEQGEQWKTRLSSLSSSSAQRLLRRVLAAIANAEDMRQTLIDFGTKIERHGAQLHFKKQSFLYQLAVQSGQLVGLMDIAEVTKLWQKVHTMFLSMQDPLRTRSENMSNSELAGATGLSKLESVLQSSLDPKFSSLKISEASSTPEFLIEPSLLQLTGSGDVKESLESTARRLKQQRHYIHGLQTLYFAFLQERKDVTREVNSVLRGESASGKQLSQVVEASTSSNFGLIHLTLQFLQENNIPTDLIPPALRVSSEQLQRSLALNVVGDLERMAVKKFWGSIDTVEEVSDELRKFLPCMLSLADEFPGLVAEEFFDTARLYWWFGYGELFKPYMDLALRFFVDRDSLDTELDVDSSDNENDCRNALRDVVLFAAFELDVFTAWDICVQNECRHGLSSYVLATTKSLVYILALIYAGDIHTAREMMRAFVSTNGSVERLPFRYLEAYNRLEVLLLRYDHQPYAAYVEAQRHADYYKQKAGQLSGMFKRQASYASHVFTAMGIRSLLDSKERKHRVLAAAQLQRAENEAGNMRGIRLELALLRARYDSTAADWDVIAELKLTVSSPRLNCDWAVLADELPTGEDAGFARCLYTEFDPQLAQRASWLNTKHKDLPAVVRQIFLENGDTTKLLAEEYYRREPFASTSTPTSQPLNASFLAGEESSKRGWQSSGSPQRPESKRRSVSFEIASRLG